MRLIVASLCLGLLALAALGCGGPNGGRTEQRLNGGGSTFVYPMMSTWASAYDQAKGVKVNYQSIGSGGGIQQMIAKTMDFGCTDAPMNEEQLQKARSAVGDVVHIPLVMGAIVPAYNLDEVSEPLRFTGPVLADIYLGKITKWNDEALKQLNPNVALPAKEIGVVQRSDGSGSTHIWTDYLSKVSPAWKDKVGVGTSVNWPVGVGQKGTEGVAGQVKRTPGSIGYIELTYALQNNIKYGLVRNKEGAFVQATLESVTAAAAGALAEIPDDLRYSLTDAPGKEAYPISGTVWAVVSTKPSGDKGRAVVDFLRWVTHEGQGRAAELHYARLPQGLIDRLEKKLDQVQVGP